MESTEVETLRHSYEALNEGDVKGCLAVLHPEAVWHESAELPDGDTVRGRAEIGSFLSDFLETWSEFHQEIEEAHVKGERVALLIHLTASGRTSGIEVDTRYAHVWTMSDGLGVSVEAYRDQAAALRALEADASTP